jgi:hypothetical protein
MNPNETPDSYGANMWISLGDVLEADERLTEFLGVEEVTAGLVATAIERKGIYVFDRFGRYMPATEEDKAWALDLVADYYDWCRDPETERRTNPSSPVEQSAGFWYGEYGRLGWATKALPDFKSIHQSVVEPPIARPVNFRKGKAPDAFVAALIKLLVRITKEYPSLDVNAMPGTKADLHELAYEWDADLRCKLSTFDDYIGPFCQFKKGRPSKEAPNFYLQLLEKEINQGKTNH